jgi:cytochrome c-type biogenesis protein CcmH/NrfG
MLWVAIFLLLSCLFIFLWHPFLQNRLHQKTKCTSILGTLLLTFGLYGYYGSPSLPDHPFIRLEGITHPSLYKSHNDLDALLENVQKDPRNSALWRDLASYYQMHHHYYESTLYYREAWRLDPQNIDLKTLYTHSLVLLNHGKITPTTEKLLQELKNSRNLPLLLEKLKEKLS